ncbi:hypothetical protein ACO0K9_03765 [Undibacterium sp. Ji50W]|uniref:hypothetical protein n=1 Tax=Undibacterium sp. Ji50W TaxID=3413041 RepID=UPI003BF177F3
MQTIERPGINLKWSKSWKADAKNLTRWRDNHGPDNIQELEHYAKYGTELKDYGIDRQHVEPPFLAWEPIATEINMYALMRLFELESQLMSNKNFDLKLASSVFDAASLAQMIVLQKHFKAPMRFKKDLRVMSLSWVPFTALGLLIGAEDAALRLARLQLLAYGKGFYTAWHHYPIFHFILRIFADYLDEPIPVLVGEPLAEPIFQKLFAIWRTPDLDELSAVCLAACDYHTHRCHSKGDAIVEFDNGDWNRLPIEILLLFKLRELSGLANPQIDHPLMNPVMAALPPEMRFIPDPLIQQVRARMMQDEYDEQVIFDQCYTWKGQIQT